MNLPKKIPKKSMQEVAILLLPFVKKMIDVDVNVEDAVDVDDDVDVARKGCRVSCLPTCWSRAPDRPRGPRLGGALFLQPTPNAQLQPFLA